MPDIAIGDLESPELKNDKLKRSMVEETPVFLDKETAKATNSRVASSHDQMHLA